MDDEEAWNAWVSNFENAKRFFKSKGNIKTRSKLKKKWQESFYEALKKAKQEEQKS